MIEQKLPTGLFQTFFVSKEISNCPLIVDMMKLGRTIDDLGIADDGFCTMSLGYGKRLLITAKNVDVRELKPQDIIEIVDYDPLKRTMLVIGAKDPALQTPVHWIIQKARKEAMAVLEITSPSILERTPFMLPMTKQQTPIGTLERAKDVLSLLRESKYLRIQNEGMLLTGLNMSEIEQFLVNTFK